MNRRQRGNSPAQRRQGVTNACPWGAADLITVAEDVVSLPRHLLLIRTDHLGDMLLTLPMATAVKQADAGVRISVLASPANAAAARHHPDVDHVEIDAVEAHGSGLRGVGRLAGQLRRLHVDAAVIVHPTPRLAWAAWRAGIALRVGSAYRAYSFLFTVRVRQHRRRPPWRHEAEYNVALLAPLGLRVERPPLPAWRVDAAEDRAVAEVLRRHGIGGERVVVLHPGSAGSAMNWGPQQYAELGRRLLAFGVRVVVTGSSAERALTAEIGAAIGAAAVDFAGTLSIGELGALLRRAALYVGSSTGPTHLAAAVGTPVLALYSPLRSQLPQRWRPLGARVQVLQPRVDQVCPKCLGPACAYYHCMQAHLSVERAFAASRQLLAGAA